VYDRAEMPGRSPRTARIIAVLSETFWLLILGVVAMFAFFLALGAFKPAEVAGLTIAVILLAALWVAHATWVSRHQTGRDPAAIRARERRGF
jgi:membrane protein YdbS with pleckstrin-like domain